MTAPASAGPPWWRRIGRRSWAYLALVALLVPASLALEASGPRGPDAGGGIVAGLIAWAVLSLGFMAANLVLLLVALRRGHGAAKPLVALALPPALVLGVLAVEAVALRGGGGDPASAAAAATAGG